MLHGKDIKLVGPSLFWLLKEGRLEICAFCAENDYKVWKSLFRDEIVHVEIKTHPIP